MKSVLTWSKNFLSELLDTFEYKLHNLSSSSPVKVDDVAAKRFLFYSLEKEITLQSYVIAKEYVEYESLAAWQDDNHGSILIRNDEDGGEVSIFVDENSKEHQWILEYLKEFSLDEVAFSTN